MGRIDIHTNLKHLLPSSLKFKERKGAHNESKPCQ